VSVSQLLTSVSIDLETLLGECNAAHGTGVSYPGSVGGSCAQYSKSVGPFPPTLVHLLSLAIETHTNQIGA